MLCGTSNLGIYLLTNCQVAATFFNLPFQSAFEDSSWPRGCFVYTITNKVYFNTNTIGNSNPNAKHICLSGSYFYVLKANMLIIKSIKIHHQKEYEKLKNILLQEFHKHLVPAHPVHHELKE